MDRNLAKSLDLVFGHEGGYVNRKSDRGGPTKYGITQRTLAGWRGRPVTADDVYNLQKAEAEDIYRQGYWAQCGGALLPDGLDYAAFDFGVNSAPSRAVRYLQKVLGVTIDGSVGPITLGAVMRYPGGVVKLIADYCDARMAFLRSLKNRKTGFPVNGRGWTIRVTGIDPKGQWPDQMGVIGNALRMARGVEPRDTRPLEQAKAQPTEANSWLKPETLVQVLPGLGGASVLAVGDGPVQWALGAVLVLGAVVTAWLLIRRKMEL
ncbi:Putative secretion activating protein [Phaeobacter inhibens]|uniref:Secretion activating protein n=1 Tax=Phaeobacter inhibens TaxID=221822 RepID=A0ABN5GRB9_9RHOB|nr:glycoside hydrolase family 108 protein [Phaeobacter inhibens]AUQ95958.1 Putative secretion activating protein [Phaeobacter inhibens]